LPSSSAQRARRPLHAQLEGEAGHLEAVRQVRAAGVDVVVELGEVVDEPARGAAGRTRRSAGGGLSRSTNLLPPISRAGRRQRAADVEVDVAARAAPHW
jgi:hypothetical protein